MAKTETLNLEVKSNIKSVTKDQKAWNKEIKKTEDSIKDVNEEGKEVVAEMQILGLSINGLKGAWTSAASGAKFLFRSIKMGIASTGVGLLILAFGTLATWFTTTKRGAEALSVAFKGIGAAIKVIVDRVSQFGSGLFKLLTGAKGGLKQMGDSFKGIGKEILTDTLYTIALEKSLQKLADRERELNVETAQRRAEIEKLKMVAEDVTKSEKERLEAAEKAFKIEGDLLDKRVKNAEEAVRLEKERLSTITDPTGEQLDVLAEKEINLANIKAESATKQIELNNKINAIEAEVAAKRAQRNQTRLDEIAAEKKAAQDLYDAQIAQADKFANDVIAIEQAVADAKIKIRDAQIDNIASGLNSIKVLAGENKAIMAGVIIAENALGIARTIISTQASNATAIAEGAALAIPTAGASVAAASGLVMSNNIAAGLSIAASIAAAQQGLSALGKGGATGGSAPSSGGGSDGGIPAPQMMSGAFALTGGTQPEPLQAYVVSDEITQSQNALEIIRRRATI